MIGSRSEWLSNGLWTFGFDRQSKLLFRLLAFAFALRLIGERFLHECGEVIGLLLPCSFEFLHLVGHLRGEIVLLGAVGFEVVERPGIAFGGDELPIADADGFVVFMQPPQESRAMVSSLAKAGARLRPGASGIGSPFHCFGFSMPTSSSTVGTMSMTCAGVVRSSFFAVMPAGQCAMSGVLMPPSCTQVL
jgi:hypothetical protein